MTLLCKLGAAQLTPRFIAAGFPVFGLEGYCVQPDVVVAQARGDSSPSGPSQPGWGSAEAPRTGKPSGGGAQVSRFGTGSLLPPTGPTPYFTLNDHLVKSRAQLKELCFQELNQKDL